MTAGDLIASDVEGNRRSFLGRTAKTTAAAKRVKREQKKSRGRGRAIRTVCLFFRRGSPPEGGRFPLIRGSKEEVLPQLAR